MPGNTILLDQFLINTIIIIRDQVGQQAIRTTSTRTEANVHLSSSTVVTPTSKTEDPRKESTITSWMIARIMREAPLQQPIRAHHLIIMRMAATLNKVLTMATRPVLAEHRMPKGARVLGAQEIAVSDQN
jgi:hypothetical protein